MGWIDAFRMRREADVFERELTARFAVDPDSIPAEVFGLQSYSSPTSIAPRIDRRGAMQVPAVKRCRDLIAGTLGTLPVDLYSPTKERVPAPLFDQPEANVPRSVTMAKTFEDLLFEGVAWWRVTEFAWTNYPAKVKRIDPRKVDVDEDRGTVWIGGKQVPNSELIRFDSPNDPLLVAGARAIRTCLTLDATAARYADEPMPLGYFSPADVTDPASDEDVSGLLADWTTARQSRVTAYVPAALKYNAVQFNAEQMQLAEQRQHAVLEIARMAGVDPEELGVSTTSRTYANQFDRRKTFVDFTLGGYLNAVQDRLSMGDVSPRGYFVRLNLDLFLRSDAKSRYEAYALGKQVGALTDEEIREAEDKPAVAQPRSQVEAADPVDVIFSDLPEHRLDAVGAGTFEVDAERRVIKGLAVPYSTTATSNGITWQFSKGTLRYADVSRVKLWIQHDAKQAVGVATELADTDVGLFAAFKVARGPEGDRALSLAEDGVLDGLSIGLGRGGKAQVRDGVHHAVDLPLMEISLTPAPAFDDARVHSVAASADTSEGTPMTAATDVEPEKTEFSSITDAIKAGFADLGQHQREVIDATGPLQVREPAPYRFDGLRGEHDFSTDLISGLRDGDGEAYDRVISFMAEAFSPTFDIDTGNVVEANPTRQRPDMYVDERRFKTPLYNALHKGSLSDQTPFIFPRFNSASGLVADHVEGVEPTPGGFDMTNQTVTPSAVSGKVEITREVWDQGGNPQVSGLIWNKMVQHYYSLLETKAYNLLNGLTLTGLEVTVTTGAADDDLVNEVEGAIVDLNFVAGGNTFDFAATHANLYKKLAGAVDASGRKLLPQYGPTNANGQSRSKFASLDVAGVEFTPVPTLGAASTASTNSYLLDTSVVHLWNSAPTRLSFEYRVAYVDLAIWGYVAAAVSDLNGVRRIKYDPVV